MAKVRSVLALAALCGSGCFYTDVINVAPEARIARMDAAPVHKGGVVTLTAASSSDDDGDQLTYSWQAFSGDAPVLASEEEVFQVPVGSHLPIRVTLEARDVHGAVGTALLQLEVADRSPGVTVQDQGEQGPANPDGSYTVTRPILFLASASDPDGDAVTLSFTVYPPPQANPAVYRFTRVNGTTYRLVTDVDGSWQVAVTGDDGYGGKATTTRTVTVGPDQPPCLTSTSPAWSPDGRVILTRAGGPRRFGVESVGDDLDPFPESDGVHFRWLTALAGEPFLEVDGHDLPDLTIDPEALLPGDELLVRVEISDRTPRVLPCLPDQAACSLTSNSCYQRLTWLAEVR